ncbi:MAG: hypothetical protein EA380_11170 [Phycisphaeraceae bacterium]|nr:MAG: hypothetical protein EA380_11170 [Phycisphaeraceae bacterium]
MKTQSGTTNRSGFANMIPVASAALLLVLSAAVIAIVQQSAGIHFRKLPIYAEGNLQLRTLPAEYPSWKMIGTERQVSSEEAKELGTENSLSRLIIEREPKDSDEPHVVDLHMAYYTGMIDTVPHVPERCNVAAGVQALGTPVVVKVPIDFSVLVKNTEADPEFHGGIIWQARSPTTFRRVNLPVGVENLRLRVSRFRDHRGEDFYAGYFFITNGEVVSSANQIRLRAFRLKDDYAYYCKIQFTSGTVRSAEELGVVAGRMLDEMFADIMVRLPDWVEVKEGRYPPERTADGAS